MLKKQKQKPVILEFYIQRRNPSERKVEKTFSVKNSQENLSPAGLL